MRSQVERLRGITVINDCYNANPASMNAAVDHGMNSGTEQTVAVLGDMLELGRQSRRFTETWASTWRRVTLLSLAELRQVRTADRCWCRQEGMSQSRL